MSIKTSPIERKREVTARIVNCSMDAYNILRKRLPEGITIDKNMVKMPSTFKAVARCHPDDAWDVEKGREIARKKVLNKYNRKMSKILTAFGDKIADYSENIDAKTDSFCRKCD